VALIFFSFPSASVFLFGKGRQITIYVNLFLLCTLTVYQQVFDKLSDDEKSTAKSAILTAQAMVAFAQDNHDSCKTLLFKA
jgi:hypothetical protein